MDTVIVIMEKNKKTGFLEREIGSLNLSENEKYIVNVYAMDDSLYLRLSDDRDLKDWEYNAVFDWFDTEVFSGKAEEITEVDDTYNPTWELKISFDENNLSEASERVEEILGIFKAEINDVFSVIADKEGEYLNEEK